VIFPLIALAWSMTFIRRQPDGDIAAASFCGRSLCKNCFPEQSSDGQSFSVFVMADFHLWSPSTKRTRAPTCAFQARPPHSLASKMWGRQNTDFLEWLLQGSFLDTYGESGGGVIMLMDGKLCGGSSDLMYLGSYTQNGDSFSADMVTKRLWLRTAGLIKEDVNIKIVGRGGFQNIKLSDRRLNCPALS
jgi:hypothetical protein